jgi:hypothetical protein
MLDVGDSLNWPGFSNHINEDAFGAGGAGLR